MRRICFVSAAGIAMSAFMGLAEKVPNDGSYRVLEGIDFDATRGIGQGVSNQPSMNELSGH